MNFVLFTTLCGVIILAFMVWQYGRLQFERGRLYERAIQGERTSRLAAQIMRGDIHDDLDAE